MDLRSKIKKSLAIHLPRLEAWALSRLGRGEIETIARHVADRSDRDPSSPLISFARAFVEKATNPPNRSTENGEQALLDRLACVPARIVFDVGANVGTWSQHALKVFPQAELHAFEIVPATYEELRRRLGAEARVRPNQLGLSDSAGKVTVNLYSSNLISSMYALDRDGQVARQIECTAQRGAHYSAAHAVEHIDALKIDVVGAEGKVLSGFEPMISGQRIRLIQFEYNRGAILGDFFLTHAYYFFSPRGYRLGKLMPDGVHFHPYHFAHEDFVGPNYVACRSGDVELLEPISFRK
jgi:FkbM family methyltransferase